MDDLGRIGLIAVSREIRPLLNVSQAANTERWGETILHKGKIAGRSVALAEVLPGPVNAALGAQSLISRYRVGAMISFGSAGALDPSLSPGDLIIVQKAVAHDSGAFLGRRFEPTGVKGRDEQGRIGFRRDFHAESGLIALAAEASRPLAGPVRFGTIVTGNQVIFATTRKRWLRHTFDALAVEMETAAVAQVAVAHGLPWCGIRAVSDSASDEFIVDFARLRVYLDDDQPVWRQELARWSYLLTHSEARRRIHRLHKGLNLAADRAAQLVVNMLEVGTEPGDSSYSS